MKTDQLTFNDLPAVVGELCDRIASMENLHQHYTLSEKSTSMLIHFPHEPQTLLYIIHCYSS